MWIWLLAIFLVIGTWVAGYFLAWPLWLEILLTVLAVLMVVGWLIFRRVRATMKARALERELLNRPRSRRSTPGPSGAPRSRSSRCRSSAGIAALKSAKLGGGKAARHALYTLPWYVIVGPPGAGKTTALKHSGLVFPYLDPAAAAASAASAARATATGGSPTRRSSSTPPAATRPSPTTTTSGSRSSTCSSSTASRKPINGVIVAISVDRPDRRDRRADRVDGQEDPRPHRRDARPACR